jgi:hypothetical protein
MEKTITLSFFVFGKKMAASRGFAVGFSGAFFNGGRC